MNQQHRPGVSATAPAAFVPRCWVAGDLNALFGLGTNNLLNLLVLTGLLLGVVGIPAPLVFGRILPAIGVMLLLTNLYYACWPTIWPAVPAAATLPPCRPAPACRTCSSWCSW